MPSASDFHSNVKLTHDLVAALTHMLPSASIGIYAYKSVDIVTDEPAVFVHEVGRGVGEVAVHG